MTVDDIARLESVLAAAESDGIKRKGQVSVHTCELIRALLYTGARFGELKRLTWSMVDFERRVLRIAITKEKRPKMIVLNDQAFAVFERHAARCGFRPEVTGKARGGDVVFDSYNPNRAWMYTIRPKAGLDAADGLPAFRLHDFRHAFVSAGVNAGLPLSVIGRAVGHRKYRHLETTRANSTMSFRESTCLNHFGEIGQPRSRVGVNSPCGTISRSARLSNRYLGDSRSGRVGS